MNNTEILETLVIEIQDKNKLLEELLHARDCEIVRLNAETAVLDFQIDQLIYTDWQKEWPTESGWWWFYGTIYDPKFWPNQEDKFFAVDVIKTSDIRFDLWHLTNGALVPATAKGKWARMVTPEPPKDEGEDGNTQTNSNL